MRKSTIVAESYNLAVDKGFNNYLEAHATSENSEIKIDEEKLIAEIESDWLNIRMSELNGESPLEYINSINSLDELIELFIDISSVSDVGVPDVVIQRLKEYGKPAADKLFNFVKDWLESKDPEKVSAVSQAVYAIGCFRYKEYRQKLIALLLECFKDDLISEAVCAAIVEYDIDILEDLIKAFNATQQPEVQEYLLTCVGEISRENQSDEIFYFLKHAFRVISNLKLAVEVLGDYGDGRAIPLLRGYILKNIKELDRATFNHIRAVIKKLGGEINDLVAHS